MSHAARIIAAAPALRIFYSESPPPASDRRLAAFNLGGRDRASLELALPPPDTRPLWEVWESPAPVQREAAQEALLAADGQLLFAGWQCDERRFPALEDGVAEAYRRLPALAAAHGYPHVVKVWHYFPRINEGEGDSERYKRFSVGRARGMAEGGLLPAATAIGVQDPASPLTVFLLAAKEPGERIENPRQVSAYRYPRRYGPVSPSFARAALMPWGQLFVSGTAAVVGHESHHPDDAAAQLREIAHNLDRLVQEAQTRQGAPLHAQAYKFFLRRRSDLAAVERSIAALFPKAPAVIVMGDICRSDLLVEAEALYGV